MITPDALAAYITYFNETFNSLEQMADGMDTGNAFKSMVKDKVSSVRDETSKEVVDILLGKVKDDVIQQFKTDMGIQ